MVSSPSTSWLAITAGQLNVSENSLDFPGPGSPEIDSLDLAIVLGSRASRILTPVVAAIPAPCHQLGAGGRHKRGSFNFCVLVVQGPEGLVSLRFDQGPGRWRCSQCAHHQLT